MYSMSYFKEKTFLLTKMIVCGIRKNNTLSILKTKITIALEVDIITKTVDKFGVDVVLCFKFIVLSFSGLCGAVGSAMGWWSSNWRHLYGS